MTTLIKINQLRTILEKLSESTEHVNVSNLQNALESAGFMVVDDRAGATGEFPDGKLVDEDEGALAITIGGYNGKVIVNFGKEVSWIGMDPKGAREFANTVVDVAREVEGN